MNRICVLSLMVSFFLMLAIVPAFGQDRSAHETSFDEVVSVMEGFEGRGNVSLMKVGKLAMSMGKTVGKAGGEWTRKVAKAFKRVSTVYMLDYGESSPSLREQIETAVKEKVIPENLVLCNKAGSQVFDETYGETSADGKHVSDLIIIMYDQSIVGIKGTVLSSDVERIVRRLNKQL